MKIILLANKDLASNYAINLLLPYLKEHQVSLFLSSKVGGNSKKPKELIRLKFFEQDLFNLSISQNLTHPDDRDSTARSFDQMDELLTQAHQQLNEINSEESLQKISRLKPDVIFSIRYGVILKKNIIKIPKHGVINLHSGSLPEYRGVMATFWALLNQEKIIGTTLHYIDDSSIDTGAIISKSQLTVNSKKTYLWHVLKVYVEGVKLIIDAINKIEDNQEITIHRQTSSGQYFTFPNQKEIDKFLNMDLELVNEGDYLNFIQKNYY